MTRLSITIIFFFFADAVLANQFCERNLLGIFKHDIIETVIPYGTRGGKVYILRKRPMLQSASSMPARKEMRLTLLHDCEYGGELRQCYPDAVAYEEARALWNAGIANDGGHEEAKVHVGFYRAWGYSLVRPARYIGRWIDEAKLPLATPAYANALIPRFITRKLQQGINPFEHDRDHLIYSSMLPSAAIEFNRTYGEFLRRLRRQASGRSAKRSLRELWKRYGETIENESDGFGRSYFSYTESWRSLNKFTDELAKDMDAFYNDFPNAPLAEEWQTLRTGALRTIGKEALIEMCIEAAVIFPNQDRTHWQRLCAG